MKKGEKTDENVIRDIKKLLSKAKHSIKVVSGEFPYEVYCEDGVADVVEKIFERGVEDKIFTGPDANKSSLSFFDSHGASVYKLKKWPTEHFIVVDGKHARLEKAHEEGQEKRTHYIVYNYKHAKELENKFDALENDWMKDYVAS
jgi:sugar-specific transcriptional regulator TrmB